jgi:hypothetical protein
MIAVIIVTEYDLQRYAKTGISVSVGARVRKQGEKIPAKLYF